MRCKARTSGVRGQPSRDASTRCSDGVSGCSSRARGNDVGYSFFFLDRHSAFFHRCSGFFDRRSGFFDRRSSSLVLGPSSFVPGARFARAFYSSLTCRAGSSRQGRHKGPWSWVLRPSFLVLALLGLFTPRRLPRGNVDRRAGQARSQKEASGLVQGTQRRSKKATGSRNKGPRTKHQGRAERTAARGRSDRCARI
jgi:hypothetical protein